MSRTLQLGDKVERLHPKRKALGSEKAMMLQYGEKVLTLLVDRQPLEHTERLLER